MALYRFHIKDRRSGKIFERDQTIEAKNKTEVRQLLAKQASRDIPQGRYGARDCGFVPFRDWEIIWTI